MRIRPLRQRLNQKLEIQDGKVFDTTNPYYVITFQDTIDTPFPPVIM